MLYELKIRVNNNDNVESDIYTRREFFREILYNNIAIVSIKHSKIYFVDTFGNFSHTVE